MASPASAETASGVIWEDSPLYKGKRLAALLCCLTIILIPIGLILWIIAKLKSSSTRYRLTSDRLSIQRGVLSKNIDDISLFRIKDIELRQSMWQRMGGIGNVLLISTDSVEPMAILECIPAPDQVRSKIRAQVDASRQREGVRTVLT